MNFTAANNVDAGQVPDELKELTMVEIMLIARVQVVMRVYQLKANGQAGQYCYTGNIINVEQDINHVARCLPHVFQKLKIRPSPRCNRSLRFSCAP